MREEKSQSSSKERRRRSTDQAALDSKIAKVKLSQNASKARQEFNKQREKQETKNMVKAHNLVHTSTVVDVDDVVSFEEETEVMALLESEKQEEGKGKSDSNTGAVRCPEKLLILLASTYSPPYLSSTMSHSGPKYQLWGTCGCCLQEQWLSFPSCTFLVMFS